MFDAHKLHYNIEFKGTEHLFHFVLNIIIKQIIDIICFCFMALLFMILCIITNCIYFYYINHFD